MAELSSIIPPEAPDIYETESKLPTTLVRVAKYSLVRLLVLMVTVVIGVYLTILIANMGGYVDEIIRADIYDRVTNALLGGWLSGISYDQQMEIADETMLLMEEAAGLNQSFFSRSIRWLWQGLMLNWGPGTTGGTQTGVGAGIKDHLPRTLLMFGVANLLLFFTTVSLALALSRRYRGWLDRLMMMLSPLSAAPPWVWGIILTVVSLQLGSRLFVGGPWDAWPGEFSLDFLVYVVKKLIPPVLAIFLSKFFHSIYAWRTFFLLYHEEEYMDLAKAKGLPARMLNRKYILRPAIPNVLTSFALLVIGLWQEVVILEHFFRVSGIGRMFVNALAVYDTVTIVALVTTFAYLIAITIFVLDIAIALLDPRVQVLGESATMKSTSKDSGIRFNLRFDHQRERLRVGFSATRVFRVSRRLVYFLLPDSAPPGMKTTLRSVVRSIRINPRAIWADMITALDQAIFNLKQAVGDSWRYFLGLLRYPSAVVGLLIITALIGVSIATFFVLPYQDAIGQWNASLEDRLYRPRVAQPSWVNQIRAFDLPETIILDSREGEVERTIEGMTEEIIQETVVFTFDYPYGGFPQELVLHVETGYEVKRPLISLAWIRPDGEEIRLTDLQPEDARNYTINRDERLARMLGGFPPEIALFAFDPAAEITVAMPGTYRLVVSGIFFEGTSNLEAEFILVGQVYGLAGTDSEGRDLLIALLWGTPIALAFGLLAAVGTSLTTMVVAAVGTWLGGWVDGLVQRITEVMMILPFLPVVMMIVTLYSNTIWAILGTIVALNIFGPSVKNYRAIFLQVKQAPYIEAAQAYGARNWRIIARYLTPRIASILVPQMILLIPGYIFIEAALAFLGLSDPTLPTWGKLINAAMSYGVVSDFNHLFLIPTAVLLVTAYGFAMVGFVMERTMQTRLDSRK